MSSSPYLDNKVLDKVLKNTNFTIASVYISLHNADPGTTGANEVANAGGSAYARQGAASFNSASASEATNNGNIDFTNLPTGTVTHFGVWDASTAGNFLLGGELVVHRVLVLGDNFRFPDTDLSVALV